jgi:hypothetical protein
MNEHDVASIFGQAYGLWVQDTASDGKLSRLRKYHCRMMYKTRRLTAVPTVTTVSVKDN